ncbi:MAG: hypothetical protein IJ461_04730 [Clostridia bacterium]|nr:hypothetical protein [Clostridia bacterium]
MDFETIAVWHRVQYPLMQGQDWAKLCYQSEFGAGHMIADQAACRQRLYEEYESTPASAAPLFERVGGGLRRLHLGPLHREGIRLEVVAKLFELAAHPRGSQEGLEKKLRQVETPETASYFEGYRQDGCPAVSHSQIYRQAYHPAYRLVPQWAQCYWQLIKAIDRMMGEKDRIIVAIDGMSGSGKSTLGAHLQALFGGNLLHMDDFFLPVEKKTPHRLSQPGGNVDHERFKAEVLKPLKVGETFSFRPFDCCKGCLGEAVTIEPQPLTIIEGCYSLHPALEMGYDLRVFLKLEPQEQSRRILERNGRALHERFIQVWIPLENAYFEAFDVEKSCQMVFK